MDLVPWIVGAYRYTPSFQMTRLQMATAFPINRAHIDAPLRFYAVALHE
jgi:hypothetical protein